MKVLHVVNSLEAGGMENGVCHLSQGLGARGWETHVACLEQRGAMADRLAGTVQVLGKAGGFSLRAAWALARAIRRVQPNVIHTHNLGPLIYASLATLGGRTRPIVHGEHSQLAPWELAPRRLRQRRKLYRGCRAVHTVSAAQVRELEKLGLHPPQLAAIPNGVDAARFLPGDGAEIRARLGLPANALVLGLVGRFGPYKRHLDLLAAFEEIAARRPLAHLLLVGAGGSEEAKVRERAQQSPARARIHLAGFQADPAPCYRAMDLLVVPSVNEGMSNAALEAMATGIPVLGHAGCGHEEIIAPEAEGIIADLASPARLGAEIEKLLAAPQRLVDMGRAARLTVVRRFSLPAMLDAYDQLYRAHAR